MVAATPTVTSAAAATRTAARTTRRERKSDLLPVESTCPHRRAYASRAPADSALDDEDAKALSAGTLREGVCAVVRQVNDGHLVQALLALDQGPPKTLPAYAGE